jgi:hypothetical protein
MKTYYYDHFEHTMSGYALRFVLTFGSITYYIIFFSSANVQSAAYKLSAFVLWFVSGFLIKETRKLLYWSDNQTTITTALILKKEITKGSFDFWRIHYQLYINHPVSNKMMAISVEKQAFNSINEGDNICVILNKHSDLMLHLRLKSIELP